MIVIQKYLETANSKENTREILSIPANMLIVERIIKEVFEVLQKEV
jgi:hypothetical protein